MSGALIHARRQRERQMFTQTEFFQGNLLGKVNLKLDFERAQKHGLAARGATEFSVGLPLLRATDSQVLHYFNITVGPDTQIPI